MTRDESSIPFEDGRWHVRVRIDGKRRRFGSYATREEAEFVRSEVLKNPQAYMEARATAAPTRFNDIEIPTMGQKKSWSSIPMPDTGGTPPEAILQIPTVDVLVLGDLHVPYHNPIMLKRAIHITKTYFPHIRDIAIIGDWWDFGMISRHPKTDEQVFLDEEIRVSGQVGRALLNHFDNAWIGNGNHCRRMAKKLDTPFHLKHLYAMAFAKEWPSCTINVTNHDYMMANSPGGDIYRSWILGHPSSYSGTGGKTPSDIASQEHRNVATGHNHLVGMIQSKCGHFLGIDVGHSTIADRHTYQYGALTKHTKWNAGFLVLSGGFPYHYTDRFTDWSRWGCE